MSRGRTLIATVLLFDNGDGTFSEDLIGSGPLEGTRVSAIAVDPEQIAEIATAAGLLVVIPDVPPP